MRDHRSSTPTMDGRIARDDGSAPSSDLPPVTVEVEARAPGSWSSAGPATRLVGED